MSFEFETKEQREAWRVIQNLGNNHRTLEDLYWPETADAFDEAAARFDEREKTCEIEPLSKWHHFLGSLELVPTIFETVEADSGWEILEEKGLAIPRKNFWHITGKGREVLSNLNAMCKVEK